MQFFINSIMNYFDSNMICFNSKEKIDIYLINKVAKAIVMHFNANKLAKHILVGNDKTPSSEYVLTTICSTLLRFGFIIDNIGVCSSPALAYLTQKNNYNLGIMLSSKDEKPENIGIIFFNSFGEYEDIEFQKKFENFMRKNLNLKTHNYGKIKNCERLKNGYVSYLKCLLKSDSPCIFDCQNGTNQFCKQIFSKYEKMHSCSYSKINKVQTEINKLAILKKACLCKKQIGFSISENGERVLLINTDGNILSSRQILFILSKFFLNFGGTIVTDTTANTAFENSLSNRKQSLIYTSNANEMLQLLKEKNLTLGGTHDGKIILKNFSNSFDGLLVAILILNVLSLSKMSLEELLTGYYE